MPDKYIGRPVLMDIARYIYGILLFFRRLYKRPASFALNNCKFTYFEHPYNGTWMNERAVEIPLVWEQVKLYAPDAVLEVGNVLSHYFLVKHLVVDKYEDRSNVIREDILNMKFDRQFDCIISISTLEHVGWDEIPRKPGKHITAIEIMRKSLSPHGKLLATIPLGYNPIFDQDLFSGKLGCNEVFYFKRLAIDRWQQSSMNEVRGSQYGRKYRTTDGLAFCVWLKSNL